MDLIGQASLIGGGLSDWRKFHLSQTKASASSGLCWRPVLSGSRLGMRANDERLCHGPLTASANHGGPSAGQ
jgi:hypothetical protein